MKRIRRIYEQIDKKLILNAIGFLIAFSIFANGISNISKETENKQTETLYIAISRNIAHYYASQGCYPESLDALEAHYKILYDRDKYFVDYQILGSNVFPDITIIEK